MSYNPILDLVFGIFMILVPFIVMGALGIAVVIYSKKEESQSTTTKPGNNPVETASPQDLLDLAAHLEDLLRKRVNGAPDPRISNGTHDQKLAQELRLWAEWEQRLQKTSGGKE